MSGDHELVSTPFAEAVLRQSADFELLGHSKAFEQVLLDNHTSREDRLVLNEIRIPRFLVPAELIEVHNYPADFKVEAMDAVLESFPKTADFDATWLFTATYRVNGQNYTMTANEQKASCNTYDNVGNSAVHTLVPATAKRFLQTIARGILLENGFPVSGKLSDDEDVAEEEIRTLISSIGNLKGKHTSTIKAYIEGVDGQNNTEHALGLPGNPNRGLLVKMLETEAPLVDSQLSLDFSMIWQLGDEAATRINSHIDEGNDWSVRYANRCHTDIEPEELPFSADFEVIDESDGSSVIFYPGSGGLNYEVANTSIMAVLNPLLKKYQHLDHDTPLEVDAAYLPDQLA